MTRRFLARLCVLLCALFAQVCGHTQYAYEYTRNHTANGVYLPLFVGGQELFLAYGVPALSISRLNEDIYVVGYAQVLDQQSVDVYLQVRSPDERLVYIHRPVLGGPYRLSATPAAVRVGLDRSAGFQVVAGLNGADRYMMSSADHLYHLFSAQDPMGLYVFRIVAVRSGADPGQPLNWLNARTFTLWVAP